MLQPYCFGRKIDKCEESERVREREKERLGGGVDEHKDNTC